MYTDSELGECVYTETHTYIYIYTYVCIDIHTYICMHKYLFIGQRRKRQDVFSELCCML